MHDLSDIRSTYPRVTDIIGKQNSDEMRNIPLDVLANACIRGERIHQYCTAWMNNLWVLDTEPEYSPYFEAFKLWANENVDKCFHSCKRLYDDELQFTGEFDMIVKMKDKDEFCLIDIKTSCSKSKTWPLQLAAYAHLCQINGFNFDKVFILHLKKNKAAVFEENEGEKLMISPPQVMAKIVNVLNREDIKPYWEIFASALNCYNYFDRKAVK